MLNIDLFTAGHVAVVGLLLMRLVDRVVSTNTVVAVAVRVAREDLVSLELRICNRRTNGQLFILQKN